jgi:hypothetical protein
MCIVAFSLSQARSVFALPILALFLVFLFLTGSGLLKTTDALKTADAYDPGFLNPLCGSSPQDFDQTFLAYLGFIRQPTLPRLWTLVGGSSMSESGVGEQRKLFLIFPSCFLQFFEADHKLRRYSVD